MPNIELYGFTLEHGPIGLHDKLVLDIWHVIDTYMPEIRKDVVITFIMNSVVFDGNRKHCPFVRVCDDNTNGEEVARAISEELHLDVEWLHINKFFKGKT